MDRLITYPGAIPLETDPLTINKNAMIGVAKLAAALFGTATFANGLTCSANSPADLTVKVSPGEIYSLQNIDDTAYSSLAADTAHQILKQGVALDTTSLSCPAPGTAGFSINYLVQAAFSEVDDTSVLLPYYNAANPSQAWSGPNNSGTQQATRRADKCVVTVKAGTAATTGTQATPSPDAGNVGLYVVTVANGQTTITAANISQYASAPLVPSGGAASNAHNALYAKSVAGSADTTLTAQEAAYPIINMTGAVTGNANMIVPAVAHQWIVINNTTGGFTRTVKTAAGTGIVVPQGKAMVLCCDGVNVTVAGAANDVSFVKSQFTATAGQTLFSGLTYTPGNIWVTRNGVNVAFTGTNGTSITLTTGANAGDLVEVYALNSFSVANAITAAGGALSGPLTGPISVSETLAGMTEVATQAETDAGTDDQRIVTPKKLRWGFAASLGASGYVAFPSWLGAFIIQWGSVTTGTGGDTTFTFPLAFPTACFRVVVSQYNTPTGSVVASAASASTTGVPVSAWTSNTGARVATLVAVFAIGN